MEHCILYSETENEMQKYSFTFIPNQQNISENCTIPVNSCGIPMQSFMPLDWEKLDPANTAIILVDFEMGLGHLQGHVSEIVNCKIKIEDEDEIHQYYF